MALDRPLLKMSKSHPNPQSRILLTDSREGITKKLRVALTDSVEGVSYDSVARPGVSNLIDIAYHIDPSGADCAADLARDFADMSLKSLKEEVAKRIDKQLSPIRERLQAILGGSPRILDDAIALGAEKASVTAAETMTLVRKAIGL